VLASRPTSLAALLARLPSLAHHITSPPPPLFILPAAERGALQEMLPAERGARAEHAEPGATYTCLVIPVDAQQPRYVRQVAADRWQVEVERLLGAPVQDLYLVPETPDAIFHAGASSNQPRNERAMAMIGGATGTAHSGAYIHVRVTMRSMADACGSAARQCGAPVVLPAGPHTPAAARSPPPRTAAPPRGAAEGPVPATRIGAGSRGAEGAAVGVSGGASRL
jgi:hypothetical protein